VKHNPELVASLEQALGAALLDPQNARLGLAWPHERVEENGTPSSFRVSGIGRGSRVVQDGTPELLTLTEPLLASKDPIADLHRIKIQLFRDEAGDEPISAAIPAVRWLAFETDFDGQRYCLHDGSWFLMDQKYADRLKALTKAIFDRGPLLNLPEWPPGDDEEAYNKLVASAVGGTVLDRELIRTELHHRGIEPCDVLAPGGVLIHVKNIENSSPASHLLAQALVSADALKYDAEARSAFRKRVAKVGGDVSQVPASPHTVVLGLARSSRLITSDDLFTFTQVTLARAVGQLEGRGVTVHVAPIRRRV
jgi:uncharacterized protein (TIGR04141 family)